MRSIRKCLFAILLFPAVSLTGCNEAQEPIQPQPDATMQAAKVLPGPTVIAALDEAIQDEYHALATYSRVLADLGYVKPFSRIVKSEAKHVAALAKQYTKYGMDVPESTWNADNVPVFADKLEACAGGMQAEIENAAMYDELLLLELPAKIQSVFTTLREASLGSHLPAFTRCK